MPLLEGTERKRKARRNWRNGFLKVTFRRYGAILAEFDKEGVDEDVAVDVVEDMAVVIMMIVVVVGAGDKMIVDTVTRHTTAILEVTVKTIDETSGGRIAEEMTVVTREGGRVVVARRYGLLGCRVSGVGSEGTDVVAAISGGDLRMDS